MLRFIFVMHETTRVKEATLRCGACKRIIGTVRVPARREMPVVATVCETCKLLRTNASHVDPLGGRLSQFFRLKRGQFCLAVG